MKIWFDTEFLEDGKTIELISIGMVREDGEELYFENANFDFNKAIGDKWLALNVMPHLKFGKFLAPKSRIIREIEGFCGAENHDWKLSKDGGYDLVKIEAWEPEFWGYYADYDWVVLCQLFGRMIDLPKHWPMFCRDVRQLGNPTIPSPAAEHNALEDARWVKAAYEELTKTNSDLSWQLEYNRAMSPT